MNFRERSGEHGIPALVLTACAPAFRDPPESVAHVAVHALTPSGVASLRMEVTGIGMAEPVAAVFPVDDDRAARGSLAVPPGKVRRIELAAVDANGVATHRGAASIPVLPGGHPPVQVLLLRV